MIFFKTRVCFFGSSDLRKALNIFLLSLVFKAISHNLFDSINESNSSVPIAIILGTLILILEYLDLNDFLSKSLFAKAKPLALPPTEPEPI